MLERSANLATDPHARVMVFVDGQNLYKACKRTFGHSLCHPHLLAEHLAGSRRQHQVACRFYTGRPDPHLDERTRIHTRNLDRRLGAMRKAGVTVVTRPLRYHWDWGHREDLPPSGPTALPQTVELRPWRRPQEKGIDLVLGLDVIEFLLTGRCDVAIVVSLDADLYEIPTAVKQLKKVVGRTVRVEAAVPVRADSKPKKLKVFDYTHQITPDIFALVRDDTDYTVDDKLWAPPKLPQRLADVEAARPWS